MIQQLRPFHVGKCQNMIGNMIFASGMSTSSSSYLLGLLHALLKRGLILTTDQLVSMNGNIADGFHKVDRVFTADRNLVCGLIISISNLLCASNRKGYNKSLSSLIIQTSFLLFIFNQGVSKSSQPDQKGILKKLYFII